MKPDLYLGKEKTPYYLKHSWVYYTTLKQSVNLGDCWKVSSPDERDFELMEKGKLIIKERHLVYKTINMNLLYGILNSLRREECFKPCMENPCGEQCVHCKCLGCYVCGIRDYWRDKC